LASLRGHYNLHTHAILGNGTTSPPTPQD
jgi:hypothetical protein